MGRLDTYIGNCGGVRLLESGRPGGPPLKERGWEPAHSSAPFWGHLPPGGGHDGRVRTPAPTGIVGEKRRAHNVRPYRRGGGNLTPHPSSLRPATFPPGGRLRKNKKGQVWNLSLKTQRRSGASHKISLPPITINLDRKAGQPVRLSFHLVPKLQ